MKSFRSTFFFLALLALVTFISKGQKTSTENSNADNHSEIATLSEKK
ncbi:hypothetical protein [Agarilytica rhodophyticola]|nr:hypothetical protein [Agarilytica rhodophyticola]